MKFDEALKQNLIDSEFISIQDAKQKGIIDSTYATYIPNTCICGSDLATNRNLTKQFCVDPRCPLKTSGRAVKLLNNFGLKGIGRTYCDSYFKENPQFNSHLAIVYGTRNDYYKTARIADSDMLINNLYKIRTTPYTFADLVSRLALPDLGSRAEIIFRGYNSLKELEDALSNANVSLNDYLVSLEGFDQLLAKKIERTLRIFHDEINSLGEYFKIKPNGYLRLEICLTGDLEYKHLTKQEFVTYLNMLGEGMVEIVSSNAKKKAAFIVSKYANMHIDEEDEDSPIINYTNKHNIGKERNETEQRKVLVTPYEMTQIVHTAVENIRRRAYKQYVGKDE